MSNPPLVSDSQVPRNKPPRLHVIDWLRGLCVLVMLGAHSLIFLSPSHENDAIRKPLGFAFGIFGPTFIWVSGFSLAYVTARAGDDRAKLRQRTTKTLWRLLLLVGISVMLRHAMWDVFNHPVRFLWVDILECIGLMQLVTLGILVLLPARMSLRLVVFAMIALIVFAAAPFVASPRQFGWATPFLNESWYGNTWPVVPWAGYGWLGSLVGVIVATSKRPLDALALSLGGLFFVSFPLTFGYAWRLWIFPEDSAWLVGNHASRVWQFAFAAVVLMAIERVAGQWLTWPATAANLYSRQSLVAWPVHLCLIYGYFDFHGFKQQVYRHDWPGYFLYAGLVLLITTAVCVAFDFTPRLFARWRARASTRAG